MLRAALAAGATDASLHSVLAHALLPHGQMADAAPHFTAAARLAPRDGYLAHLAAAANGTGTERATDSYVAALFDGYAPRFEQALLALGYRVPGLVRRAVERLLPLVAAGAPSWAGTRPRLRHRPRRRGPGGLPRRAVDRRRSLPRHAGAGRRQGPLCRALQAEIGAALRQGLPPQAVVAADVFVYFGRLEEVSALPPALAPDGLLLFSTESFQPEDADAASWQLGRRAAMRMRRPTCATASRPPASRSSSAARRRCGWMPMPHRRAADRRPAGRPPVGPRVGH